MSSTRILFVDRDGTLIEEPADFQVDALDKIRLLPDVIAALLELKAAGYRFVMVTNQDGLGSQRYPQERFDQVQQFVLRLFGSQGIEFERCFVCPHFEHDACSCRKPLTGLLTDYADQFPAWPRSTETCPKPRETASCEGFAVVKFRSWSPPTSSAAASRKVMRWSRR